MALQSLNNDFCKTLKTPFCCLKKVNNNKSHIFFYLANGGERWQRSFNRSHFQRTNGQDIIIISYHLAVTLNMLTFFLTSYLVGTFEASVSSSSLDYQDAIKKNPAKLETADLLTHFSSNGFELNQAKPVNLSSMSNENLSLKIFKISDEILSINTDAGVKINEYVENVSFTIEANKSKNNSKTKDKKSKHDPKTLVRYDEDKENCGRMPLINNSNEFNSLVKKTSNTDLYMTEINKVGTGLINVNNNCYLNATLQCLAYTTPFRQWLAAKPHAPLCKLKKSSIFCSLCEVEFIIYDIFDSSGNKCALPSTSKLCFNIKSK